MGLQRKGEEVDAFRKRKFELQGMERFQGVGYMISLQVLKRLKG